MHHCGLLRLGGVLGKDAETTIDRVVGQLLVGHNVAAFAAARSLIAAVVRRAREELGVTMSTLPIWHFSFIYHARYQAVGSEHELCHVYSDLLPEDELKPVPSEVSEYRWVEPAELDAQLRDSGEAYSPWLHIEWPRLRRLLPDGAGARIVRPRGASA